MQKSRSGMNAFSFWIVSTTKWDRRTSKEKMYDRPAQGEEVK